MSLTRFDRIVRSVEELESLIGSPSELVIKKQLAYLDAHMQAFIARSPFLLLGTVGNDGKCDVSPRGDLPAVATVLDASTLLIPERPGNRRADSLRNIIATERVGILLLVPGVGETLRVNGRACVTCDQNLLASRSVNGKVPAVGIGVEVEECYFQCAKALIRSTLWKRETDDSKFDFANVLIEQTGSNDSSTDELREQIEESYRNRLY